jgi:hypothetical protein
LLGDVDHPRGLLSLWRHNDVVERLRQLAIGDVLGE